MQPDPHHCQRGCQKAVISYDPRNKNEDMIGRVNEQANAWDHYVLSAAGQIRRLGSKEHFGCNGQGLHPFGTISIISSEYQNLWQNLLQKVQVVTSG